MAGAVITVGILAFVSQPLLAQRMDEWRLLPRPEHVTELYFADHHQLSDRTRFGTEQTASFTVHNLEHQTTNYSYTLSVMSEDDLVDRPLTSGSFSLDHDHSRTTARSVTLPKSKGRVAVKVTLEYEGITLGDDVASPQKQSIHYWTVAPEELSEREKAQ